MTQDAIQTDASEIVEEEVVVSTDVEPVVEEEEKPSVLERDSLMTDLAKRRKEQHAEGNIDDQDDDIPASDIDPEASATLTQTADDDLVELKVNGQQMFRTVKEVADAGGVPAIQKQLSGDMKLKAAAVENQTLDQRKLDLDERERVIAEKEAQPAPVVSTDETTPSVDTKALAENLVLGDTEKVAGAIDSIIKATQQPGQQQPVQTVQPAQPTQAIDKDALKEEIRFDLAKDKAVEDFKKDFKDVYDHPGNKILANQETINIQKEHPDWEPSAVLTEAGKRTRAIIKSSAPELTPLEQKRLSKQASVDQIPQAHSRGVAPAETETKPKTKKQIFEQMEASRSH